MPEYTSRLKLIKPGESEDVNIDDLNTNFDTLDSSPGTFICTSTTRPANPFVGQDIYETNTKRKLVWDGSDWRALSTVSDSRARYDGERFNGNVNPGTGGYAPRAIEINPGVFLLKGRVTYIGAGIGGEIPDTLRWFYLPAAATPTGPQAWQQVNAVIAETNRAVVFRINSSNYETENRRGAVEMLGSLPLSINGGIYFDSVYVV